MGSGLDAEASPARGTLEGFGVVKRRCQHQQTRAAAAREGCRREDAARKNRRPCERGGDGVLEVVTGPVVGVGGGRGGPVDVVVCMGAGWRFDKR